MSKPRIIDTHVHLWDWQLATYDWISDEMAAIRRPFSLRDLAAHLDSNAVTGVVLVQTCPEPRETREYLALAAEQPIVAGVVGWVDLTDPNVDDVLAELRRGPGGARLVGIRHQVHDEVDPGWLDRTDVRRGIAAVGSHALAYDLLIRPRELPAAIRLVEDLHEQSFVVDHIAKPPIGAGDREHWESRLRRLASHPQVSCKLSGMVTEADWSSWSTGDLRPYADVVLDAFGPDRVLFGSDWPVCTLAATYDEVVGAARTLIESLDEHESERVLFSNAVETYRLVPER